MCHVVCRIRYGKGIVGVSRNLCAVLGPIDEVVASGRGSRQGTGLSVIISSFACNGAAIVWVSRDVNCETLQLEMCHVFCRFFCHSEGIAGICGYLRPIFGPVDEVVACGGCCC